MPLCLAFLGIFLALFALSWALGAACARALPKQHPAIAYARFLQAAFLLAAFCAGISLYFSVLSGIGTQFVLFVINSMTAGGSAYCASEAYPALKQQFERRKPGLSEP